MRPSLRSYALGLAVAVGTAGQCLGQVTTEWRSWPADGARPTVTPVMAAEPPERVSTAGHNVGAAVAQSAMGQSCPSCLPPVAAPAAPAGPAWHHPLFPLFRPRPAQPMIPTMPAPTTPVPEKIPDKTPEKTPDNV